MIIDAILLIIGFLILIKSSSIFVDGASSIASHLKMSKIMVGLTIVAFGTSAPEIAIGFQSMIDSAGDIVVGNVIGSNILNILLVLGITSCVGTIHIKKNTIKKEMPLLIIISILFSVLCLDNFFNQHADNILSRADGVVILIFYSVFLFYIFSTLKKNKNKEFEEPAFSLLISIIYIVLGLLLIIFASDLVVNKAILIASNIGVSERIISLTVLAMGTSLPELVTGITALKKKETDLVIGNIIGSNILNICLVIGLPVAIFGSISLANFTIFDFIFLNISSILVYHYGSINNNIIKKEGKVFLCLLGVYLLTLII